MCQRTLTALQLVEQSRGPLALAGPIQKQCYSLFHFGSRESSEILGSLIPSLHHISSRKFTHCVCEKSVLFNVQETPPRLRRSSMLVLGNSSSTICFSLSTMSSMPASLACCCQCSKQGGTHGRNST